VGLLDLVEQDDGIALAADRLGELAALVEADVAGRARDQSADVVALHELAHVDLDERVLAAEHELGQRLGQFGLADAGGAEEDERADRPLGILRPARARRTAFDTISIASCWPMTRLWRSSSMCRSRSDSSRRFA